MYSVRISNFDHIPYTSLITHVFVTSIGLIRLQEILKHAEPGHKWFVRRLAAGGDNRPLFKAVKTTGVTRVIIDCPANRILEYLRQANEVKFFEDYMVCSLKAKYLTTTFKL